MRTSTVRRRDVLKLGVAAIIYSLMTRTSGTGSDDVTPVSALPLLPVRAAADSLSDAVWLWQRTRYSDGTTVVCSNPSVYTLTFLPGGLYSVQADCNQGSGTYTVDGSKLTLQQGPMTLAACPPGSQDTVFLRDLFRVAAFVFDGENLVLNLEMDSGSMVFSPRPPVSLTGPAWQVLSVNNGHGGLASVVADTQLNATFGEDGVVSGSTGCNIYRGLYASSGLNIVFGPLISTRRACPSEEATAQEQAFLAALGASTRYELRGDRLTLRDDEGAAQVDMVRPPG